MREGNPPTRRDVLSGAGASFAVLALPRPALDPAPDPQDLLRFFDRLALMRGNRRGDARASWVRKWSGPVVVTLYDAPAPLWSALDGLLGRLQGLVGVPLTLSRRTVRGNRITVRVIPQRSLAERYDTAVCMTSSFGRGGRLHTAHVELGADYLDCLAHEMMHAMGFDNHWYGDGVGVSMQSALAPRHSPLRAPGLSRYDRMALGLLYDSGLEPGMPRPLALPAAGQVLDKIFRRGS
jgi:hypothetical protein